VADSELIRAVRLAGGMQDCERAVLRRHLQS